MVTLPRDVVWLLRSALIAVLRILEDALELPDDQRALRPPRRRRGAA